MEIHQIKPIYIHQTKPKAHQTNYLMSATYLPCKIKLIKHISRKLQLYIDKLVPHKPQGASGLNDYHKNIFLFSLHAKIDSQSVLRRNKCICSNSHMLCYGCVQSCAIHNTFALHGGDVMHACHAIKTKCLWSQTMSNLIT